jgi:hypothetical protein
LAPIGRSPEAIANADGLPFGVDCRGAGSPEIVETVLAIPAGAVRPHLDQPRPQG